MFMYGNSLEDSRSCRERVFPYLLSQAVEYFDFGDCNFRIQKAKEATARVVMYRELSISNSYTLEASFCGSDVDHHSGSHFNTTNYQHMGRMLCSTILEWAKPDQVRVASALVELQAMMAAESEEHVAEEEQDVSDPEDDEPATDQPTKTTRDKPTAKDREDSNGAKLIRAQQQQQQKRRTRRRALREAAFIAEMTELNNTAFFMPSIIRDVTAKTPSVVRRGQATRGQNAGELRRTESLGSSSNGMAPCSSANARKGREGDAARRDMSMDGRLQHTALPATGGGRSKVPRKAPETPPNKPLAAKSSQKGVTGTNANGPPTLLPARPVHRLLLPHAGTLKRTSTPPSPALMRPPSQPPFSPSPSPPPSYQQWVGGRLQGGRRSDLPGGGAGTASQRGGNGGRGRASRPLPLMSLNVSVEGKTAANLLERGQEVKAKGEVMPKSVSPRPLPVDKKVDKKGKEDGKAVGNSKDAAWETVAKAGSHKKNKAQKRKKRQSKSRAPPLTATQPTATGQSEDGSYAPQDMAVTRPVPRPTPFAAPLLPFPPFLLLLRQPSGAGRLLDPDPGSRSYL
uniref:Peptidase M14 domain-containing protein n=1 Tax=Vitrella brassicaformis TaxID=1169539 RepID=A0A7S1K7U0_9ALVE|mmetsp:Transcript_41138/g.102751  ORF Transcript_41138/g.102751 Transcript_41138/m.102751 type:complete len:570 (+) Transcript_41138:41-1750(+)